MRDKIELTGMVLSATLVGDYDKRLVILTKERGKITAFAKGARKPNSPYLGVSEPFNFGKFTLLEGFDAYRFLGAEIKEYFQDVKNDIEGVCYGTYFAEILEYFCVEGIGDVNVLNLFYASLKALVNPSVPNQLLRRIFELKILALEGEGMGVFSCARCGNEKVFGFDIKSNGLICEDCMKSFEAKKLSESSVYTLQYIISSPIDRLYTFRVKDKIFCELDGVIGEYFDSRVQKNFKSMQILATLS